MTAIATAERKEIQPPTPLGNWPKEALFASLTVWLVVICIAVDGLCRIADIHKPGTYAEKVVQFIQSDKHPEAVILGSSAALSSAYESDRATGVITGKEDKGNYCGAVQLGQTIYAETGKNLAIMNVACFGATANYAWMCTKKMIEFGKTPKVIILEMVSRDLFDASMPRGFESDYYRCLTFLHPHCDKIPQPLQGMADWIMGNQIVTFAVSLFSDDQMMRNPERLRFELDSFLGSLVNVYSNRTNIMSRLTVLGMQLRERVSGDARRKYKDGQAGASFQVDPTPQLGRYEDEKVYFVKLLQLCKSHNIRLIVVNLPVLEGFEKLVPQQLRPRWPSEIIQESARYGFSVIDLNDKSSFTQDDFLDSAHLNQRGALKVNVRLSKEIARRHLLDGI